MANEVLFKRGTQASLNTLLTTANSAVAGSFYLTSDTNRLYIGKDISKTATPDIRPVAVNQGVITVASVSALNNNVSVTNANMGQFYYCEAENVLCVLSGSTEGGGTPRWVQINPDTDTYVDDFDITVATSNGVATVTSTIGQKKDLGTGTPQSVQDKSDSFTLTGDNGITVSNTDNAITIDGEHYEVDLTDNATPDIYDIKLKSDKQDSAANDRDSLISIVQGSNITLTRNNKQLTIAATDTSLAGNTAGVDVEPGIAANNTNGFTVTVTDSAGNEKSGTIDPTIQLGTHSDALVHFDNGKATLNVYTKDEVDGKIQDFDAMSYAGTLGSQGVYSNINIGSTTAGSSSLKEAHSGDTFKVAGNVDDLLLANKLKDKDGKYYGGTADSTHNGIQITSGDLLIAGGTEDSDGKITAASLYFDYVPSGDDVDSKYRTATIDNGSKLQDITNANNPIDLGGIQIDATGELSVADNQTAGTASVINKVTVTHKTQTGLSATNTFTPAADNTTGHNTDANDGYTMSAASGVTSNYLNIQVPVINYNQYGHITSISYKTYRVIDSHGSGTTIQDFLIQSASATGNAASTVLKSTATLRLATQNASSQNENFDLKLVSNSLTMAKPANSSDLFDGAAFDLKIDLVWGTF